MYIIIYNYFSIFFIQGNTCSGSFLYEIFFTSQYFELEYLCLPPLMMIDMIIISNACRVFAWDNLDNRLTSILGLIIHRVERSTVTFRWLYHAALIRILLFRYCSELFNGYLLCAVWRGVIYIYIYIYMTGLTTHCSDFAHFMATECFDFWSFCLVYNLMLFVYFVLLGIRYICLNYEYYGHWHYQWYWLPYISYQEITVILGNAVG